MFIKKYLSLLLFSIILVEISFPVTLSAVKEKKTNTKNIKQKEIKQKQEEKIKQKQEEKKPQAPKSRLSEKEKKVYKRLHTYLKNGVNQDHIISFIENLPIVLENISTATDPIKTFKEDYLNKLINYVKEAQEELQKDNRDCELNLKEAHTTGKEIINYLNSTDEIQLIKGIQNILEKYNPIKALETELEKIPNPTRQKAIIDHGNKVNDWLFAQVVSAKTPYSLPTRVTRYDLFYTNLIYLIYEYLPKLIESCTNNTDINNPLFNFINFVEKSFTLEKTPSIERNTFFTLWLFKELIKSNTYKPADIEELCKNVRSFLKDSVTSRPPFSWISSESDNPRKEIVKLFLKKGAATVKEIKGVNNTFVLALEAGNDDLAIIIQENDQEVVKKDTKISKSISRPPIYYAIDVLGTSTTIHPLCLSYITSSFKESINKVITPQENQGSCLSPLIIRNQHKYIMVDEAAFGIHYFFLTLIKDGDANPFLHLPQYCCDEDFDAWEKSGIDQDLVENRRNKKNPDSPLRILARGLNQGKDNPYLIKSICKTIDQKIKAKIFSIPPNYFTERFDLGLDYNSDEGTIFDVTAGKDSSSNKILFRYLCRWDTELKSHAQNLNLKEPFHSILHDEYECNQKNSSQELKLKKKSLNNFFKDTKYRASLRDILKNNEKGPFGFNDWLYKNDPTLLDQPVTQAQEGLNQNNSSIPEQQQSNPEKFNKQDIESNNNNTPQQQQPTQQPLNQQNIESNNMLNSNNISPVSEQQQSTLESDILAKILFPDKKEQPESTGQWKIALAFGGGVALFIIAALLVNHYKKDVFFIEVLKGWLSKKPIKPLELASPQLLVGYQQYTNGTLPRLPLTQLGIVA